MSWRFAARAGRIQASGIRRIFDLARQVKDPVNLSIGQPDYDVPDAVKRAALAAIAAGQNRYTPTQGLAELQAAVREHLRRTRDFDPEAVLITSGVSGALTLAFLALLDEGDEVIVPDPYFVSYRHLAHLCGARPVFVDTYPDFRPRPEALGRAITARTRLLLLNQPANPTGIVLTREELSALAAIAREADLPVLADEVYDDFVYDRPFASLVEFLPDTLLLGGFSKRAAMTGWRVGYAAGPAPIIEEMAKLQQYTFVCAPTPFQLAAIDACREDLEPVRTAYRRKRDLLWNGLREKYGPVKPEGAFYLFLPLPDGISGTEFAERAVKERLLLVPGGAFSERDTHVRLSFAAPDAELQKGVEILNRLV